MTESWLRLEFLYVALVAPLSVRRCSFVSSFACAAESSMPPVLFAFSSGGEIAEQVFLERLLLVHRVVLSL